MKRLVFILSILFLGFYANAQFGIHAQIETESPRNILAPPMVKFTYDFDKSFVRTSAVASYNIIGANVGIKVPYFALEAGGRARFVPTTVYYWVVERVVSPGGVVYYTNIMKSKQASRAVFQFVATASFRIEYKRLEINLGVGVLAERTACPIGHVTIGYRFI